MAFVIGLLGMLGIFIFGTTAIVGLIRKDGSAKKLGIYAGVSFILFIIALSINGNPEETVTPEAEKVAAESDDTVEKSADKKTEAAPKVESKPKEKITLTYEEVRYDPEAEHFIIEATTNLVDGTDIRFKLTESETVAIGTVKDGKVNANLGGFVDENETKEYITNGTYKMYASVFVNKEDNADLIDEYGNFEQLDTNYEVDDGSVSKSIEGYLFSFSSIEVEVTNGYTQEEVDSIKLDEQKASAKSIDFAHLDKNPDRHIGEYVTYTGEILQIMEGNGVTNIRLALDDWGNDVLFVEYNGYTDFIDGDTVTIYGTVDGSYTYTSQAGWEITLPNIMADIIE